MPQVASAHTTHQRPPGIGRRQLLPNRQIRMLIDPERYRHTLNPFLQTTADQA